MCRQTFSLAARDTEIVCKLITRGKCDCCSGKLGRVFSLCATQRMICYSRYLNENISIHRTLRETFHARTHKYSYFKGVIKKLHA